MNKGVHLLYSHAFSLRTRIKLPSKLHGGKKKQNTETCAEYRNLHDNQQPDVLIGFLIPFLTVFALVHALCSDCQDNNLVASANRK